VASSRPSVERQASDEIAKGSPSRLGQPGEPHSENKHPKPQKTLRNHNQNPRQGKLNFTKAKTEPTRPLPPEAGITNIKNQSKRSPIVAKITTAPRQRMEEVATLRWGPGVQHSTGRTTRTTPTKHATASRLGLPPTTQPAQSDSGTPDQGLSARAKEKRNERGRGRMKR